MRTVGMLSEAPVAGRNAYMFRSNVSVLLELTANSCEQGQAEEHSSD